MSLKDTRIENQLSQSELSKASGVSLRTIQEYEQGKRDLLKASLYIAMKLSLALNTTVENLIDLDEVENMKKEIERKETNI